MLHVPTVIDWLFGTIIGDVKLAAVMAKQLLVIYLHFILSLTRGAAALILRTASGHLSFLGWVLVVLVPSVTADCILLFCLFSLLVLP